MLEVRHRLIVVQMISTRETTIIQIYKVGWNLALSKLRVFIHIVIDRLRVLRGLEVGCFFLAVARFWAR